LCSAYISNALLWDRGPFYLALFLIQNLLILDALGQHYLERIGLVGPLWVFSRYFCLLNIASAHAFGKFLLGKKQAVWAPRKG
jgi:hypothetical protein